MVEMTKTIKLLCPIGDKDNPVNEVTVRRTKAGDFRKLSITPGVFTFDVEKQYSFVSNNTGLTIEQIDELDTEDYSKVLNQLTAFLGLSAVNN